MLSILKLSAEVISQMQYIESLQYFQLDLMRNIGFAYKYFIKRLKFFLLFCIFSLNENNTKYYMNFNRIQKYRAQRTTLEQTGTKANHHIRPNDRIQPANENALRSETVKQTGHFKILPENASSGSYIHSKGILLRDYMYITSKSQKKQQTNKKQNHSQSSIRSNSSDRIGLLSKNSFQTRSKYQASNQEIYQLVKQDISNDLTKISEKTQQLRIKFSKMFQQKCEDNQKMLQFYHMRKVLKDNVMKELETIEQFIKNGVSGYKSHRQNLKIHAINQNDQKKKQQQRGISKSLYINQMQISLGGKKITTSFKQ